MADQAQVALLLCDKHGEEEMDMYCKTCKRPTCTECLKTEHHGHDLDTIPKLYRKIKNKRMDLIRNMEAKVNPVRTKNHRHIRNVKCRNETLLKQNLENAEKKRVELHRTVDDIVDSHIQCMTEHSQKLGEEIDREVDKLQEDESELMKMLETFEKTTMVGLDLIEYYEKLKAKTDTLHTLDISQCCSKQVYQECQIDFNSLTKMIGEVSDISTSTNSVDMISFFKHKDTLVHTMWPISDNESWLTYMDTGEFTLIHRDGRHIKSVTKDSFGLSFLLHDGRFLVCNPKQKNILKVDISGKSSVWMDTSPFEAGYIGEARNGNILISLRDEDSGTRTEHSQRSVRMVTPSVDVLHSYEFGEDGITPVLTCPGRVTQNYNSDVCVENLYEIAKDNWRGNVCVFYEDGGLRFSYKGNGEEFTPSGICCVISSVQITVSPPGTQSTWSAVKVLSWSICSQVTHVYRILGHWHYTEVYCGWGLKEEKYACTDTSTDQRRYVASSFAADIYFFHIHVEYANYIYSSTLSNFSSVCVLFKSYMCFMFMIQHFIIFRHVNLLLLQKFSIIYTASLWNHLSMEIKDCSK